MPRYQAQAQARHSSPAVTHSSPTAPTSKGPPPRQTVTARLTENKRRYRARRKEYVSDLERRLAESRQHGVQASKEMQLAARQVEKENAKLRDLLNLAGFRDEEIRAWLGPAACSSEPGGDGSAWLAACERRAAECAATATTHRLGCASDQGVTEHSAGAQPACQTPPSQSTDDLSIVDKGIADEETPYPPVQDHTATCHRPSTTQCTPPQSEPSCPSVASPSCSEKTPADPSAKQPCKLLSRLAQNPGADLTQIPIAPRSSDADLQTGDDEAGVECSRAYEMLMRYATTEEKMDTIAQALEGGCKQNGGGRCSVKREVVWQVLDGMCG